MKTPKFWNNKGIISSAFLPIGLIYSFITQLRMKFVKSNAVDIPVICIGNLTAGGTGKTPVAISICEILRKENHKPFFVSRGYGGKLSYIAVNNQKHKPEDVGDEPLLLSQAANVIIGADRYKAGKIAQDMGADIIIMDDGFQNPYLKKDLSFIVVDGGFGLGNKRPIPSGPLRESFKSGIKRADAIIIIGDDIHNISKEIKEKPIFIGRIEPILESLANQNILAFAGIGRPAKFYESLKKLNANIVKTIDFPDHHKYENNELENIIEEAKKLKAKIYTTSKDFVKIPNKLRNHFNVLDIRIKWEKPEDLASFIFNKIIF